MDATPVIDFKNVSREIFDAKKGRRAVLHDVTATLPGTEKLALMGADLDVLSAFLHLVAGSDVPERGRVTSSGLRFSPIVNAGGSPGTLLPQISVMENIQFFARQHSIDATRLAQVVDKACRLGPLLKGPTRGIDGGKRRALEVAIIAALPYDCYLIDRLDTIAPEFRWLITHSARIRNAGMLFVTADIRVAKQLGANGFIVEGGGLRPHKGLGHSRTAEMRDMSFHE